MTTMLMGLRPTHPGEILREDVIPALGRSKTAIAAALGVSRHTLYKVLDERSPVTPQLAVRLGKLCGNGPEIWGRMQLAFDLAAAATVVDVESIPTLGAA